MVTHETRWQFSADVRDQLGRTLYQIDDQEHLDVLLDSGHMRNRDDIAGLAAYLRSLRILHGSATIASKRYAPARRKAA